MMALETSVIVPRICGLSSARLVSRLSWIRWRKRPLRLDSFMVGAPSGQALAVEGEIGDSRPMLYQRLCHLVSSLNVAVEEHVAAATGTGDLATERPVLQRLVIRLVDEGVADLRGKSLLVLPSGTEQLAELPEPALQQRVLHLDGELLLHPQAGQRIVLPCLEARGLVVNDPVRRPSAPRVTEKHVRLQLVDCVSGDSERIDDNSIPVELDEVEPAKGCRVL